MQTAPVAWGDTGLQPAVSVSTQSAPEGIRTPNLLIRSQMLYPLSYGCVVPSRGGTKSYLSASGRHRRNRPPQRHDGPSSRGPDGVCRPVAHPTRRPFVPYLQVVKILQETDNSSSHFLRPGPVVSRLTASPTACGETASRRRVP